MTALATVSQARRDSARLTQILADMLNYNSPVQLTQAQHAALLKAVRVATQSPITTQHNTKEIRHDRFPPTILSCQCDTCTFARSLLPIRK